MVQLLGILFSFDRIFLSETNAIINKNQGSKYTKVVDQKSTNKHSEIQQKKENRNEEKHCQTAISVQ